MYSLKKWLFNCSSFTNSNIWRLTQMGLWMQDQTEVRFEKGGGKRFQNRPKKTSGHIWGCNCHATLQTNHTNQKQTFSDLVSYPKLWYICNRGPSKQQLLYCKFIGPSIFNTIINYNAKVIVRKYRKLLSWIVQDLPLWKDAQSKWRWDHQHK